jgi:delta-aminolevulinic acid dehydratase/porphobilinogen synthase
MTIINTANEQRNDSFVPIVLLVFNKRRRSSQTEYTSNRYIVEFPQIQQDDMFAPILIERKEVIESRLAPLRRQFRKSVTQIAANRKQYLSIGRQY